MPRTLGQAIGFLLGFAIALWLSPFAGTAGEAAANTAPYAVLEAELHAQVLAFRGKVHMIPLHRRADLDAVARDHAADMAARGYLNHVSLEGANPLDRFRRAGVLGFTLAAENIGKTNRPNPNREVVDGWIASPVHRQNLDTPPFNATGIGVARTRDGSFIYTQIYATFPAYE